MRKKLLILSLSVVGLFPVVAADTNSGAFSGQKIAETFAALDAKNSYSEEFTAAELNMLPCGVKKTINNNEFAVAVSNLALHNDYAELTVFARMKISQRPAPLYFAAAGLKFFYDTGFGGDASLVLLGDVDIPINEHTKLTLRGGSLDTETGAVAPGKKTALSVDCSGFKELEVEAGLVFSESFIQKVSESGSVLPDPVSADFSIVVNDWSNLFVQINLPTFQIKGLDGFLFTLSDISFDFSDHQNPAPSAFPSGYAARYMIGGSPDLWRGVSAKNLKVTLPKDFSKNGAPVSFSAQNLLIDDNGISGLFTGENILPIDIGNASGWAFSIRKFFLEMEAHKIKSGGFDGLIGLPVGDSVLLDYRAQIMGNNNYQLVVALKDTLDFDMLMGKATLAPNSSVTIQMKNGKFMPEANLNGFLTIQADVSGEETQLKNIEFRSLRFKTEVPYASVGYMGYAGEIKLFNLPASISHISVEAPSDRLNLGFDLSINLDDKYLSASSRLNISSRYITTNDRGQWKYQGLKIDKIGLQNCEIAGLISLSGNLELMENDPVYGNGFSGDIELKFKKIIEGCSVSVAVAFGSKNGLRYWFVDGAATFPTPIPVVGAIGINGFGGGACMGMKRVLNGGLGKSKTGCGFLPDKNLGLGLKAAVFFKTMQGNALSGEASFEMLFNNSGGINTIGFYGYAEFAGNIPGLEGGIAKISSAFKGFVDKENQLTQGNPSGISALEKNKQENPSEAAKQSTGAEEKAANANIAAAVGILYSVQERTLHANFDFYVNAAGGMIRGTASNHRAGVGVLHISPQKWYVFLGRPDDRIGLQVGIPGIATVKADSYFMLGDDIPGSPPPPLEVSSYLSQKGESYNYMRDLNGLQSGRGIAFGASLGFSTGDLTFLILYARFQAKAGFDIMIKDYQNAQCRGRSGPIGINGWYANGQAYAYLGGELGVKVNLKFFKGRFPIISGGCAALLQAKLPNPTWFGGAMGVHFNLLGGLVKGNMRFKFNIGEECEIIFPGTSPLEVSMISDLSPTPNAAEVDVFTAPQLALTNPARTEFEMSDENGTKKYRIFLDKFTLKDGNNSIPGEIKWSSENTVATFYSHEVLPPYKSLKLEVAVGFEEYANGRWSVVSTSGQKALETRDLTFTTGGAPDYIPEHNVEYAYPVKNQLYYYPKESTKGYVQLKRGQEYLFPTNGWSYSVQIDRSDRSEKKNFTYDASNKRLHYDLPNLVRNEAYSIDFISTPTATSSSTSTQQKETVLLSEEDNLVTQTSAAAGQVIRESSGKSLLAYAFRSSKYYTFKEKVSNLRKVNVMTDLDGPYTVGLSFRISSPEEFDDVETYGTEESGNKALITAQAVLTDDYYKQLIYPLLYKDYPAAPNLQLGRESDGIGVPPVYGFGKWVETEKFPVRYYIPKYYLNDFRELRAKYVNGGQANHPLVNASFPDILSGKYPAILQYVLPGGESGTSVNFDYEINKK
jgi:hypothetical protein